ncbi:hypothetical protein MMC08_007408 [Hypocenomyce scalaris]|nr:hypothetical protein [Hypocenomyce scalaris]
MLRCIEKVSQICEGQRKAQVLHWVSPVKYENPHHAKEAMSGTGRWLLQDAKYRGWRRASQSSTLWLQGFMGSGKSCLAHVVIEDLRKASATADGEKIAFFYCDGTTQEQASQITNVISILRCLLKQLSDFGIEKRLPNLVVKAYDENSLKVDLTEQESLSLILQMVTVYPSTILVIDGLDECPTEVQRKLVSNINEILRRSPTLVKVFISSRPTPEIVDLLEPLEVTEITTLENNTRDIEDLVIHEVAEAASSPGLRKLYHRGKNSHKEAVIDKLLVNAQGMFRWVQLSLIYLHGSANFFELGERLHQISQLEGLFELYDLIYKRMMDNRDEKNGIAIRTILLFLLYGKAVHDEYLDRKRHLVGEPSRLHSALEAASFAANLSDVIYKAEDIVALCPSFLSLEETSTHSKLALPHFSVKEYLTTKHSDLYSPQNGNAFIAELCIQAFIKLNLEDLRVLPNFALYSATYWASHLLELGFINGERDSIDRILSGRVSLQAAFRSFILESQATESFQLWTTYMDEQRQRSRFPASYLVTSPPSSLFARLFLDCGWSSPDQSEAALNVKTDFGMTSIQFATVLGNTKAVEWLAKHGLDVNAQDSSGQNALFYAFLLALPVVDVYHFRWLGNLKFNRRTRIEHTVRTLVRLGVNVNFRSHRGSTALHFIAADCDEATTSCLLENGADIYAQDSDGQTPLHAYVAESKKSSPMFRYFIAQPPLLAMANNFGETVLHLVQDPLIEELLAKVSDCEPRNIHGATPLHYAVRNDDRKKVAALLARHVDVNAQTKDGCSVLHIAAERYRRSSLMTALETLISAGANGNLKTRDGKTPLHYYYLVIVGNRGDYFRGELHEQILQMFLEAGVDPNAVDDAGMVARDYLDGSSSMLIDRHLRVTEMRGFKK